MIQTVGIQDRLRISILRNGDGDDVTPIAPCMGDDFREDRSTADISRNNLALLRKFAYNIVRIAAVYEDMMGRSFLEIMDTLSDNLNLLEKYCLKPIKSFY